MRTPEERARAVVDNKEPCYATEGELLTMQTFVVRDLERWIADAIKQAVAEEREACAALVKRYESNDGSDLCDHLADAIRKRGEVRP